jgi:pimeloyl-ACP methyl ester carboxylesterase
MNNDTVNGSGPTHRSIDTRSGHISYTDVGSGPVLLFVHGVLMNKHLWRHQIHALSDIRRCIAIDLLAHGDTEIDTDQDVSVTANAAMIAEFLDALDIDRVDIVGNDSGGGICQIFAALNPDRVRTLTLTDCDASDNWPPAAFQPFVDMAVAGGLHGALTAMLTDTSRFRAPEALGPAYQDPTSVSDADIEIYLTPFLRTERRTRDLQRFLAAFDNRHTLAIESQLRTLEAPTLIVWGTDDVYFPTRWAHWLAETIPGAGTPVEVPGARLFFVEEQPQALTAPLRAHLLAHGDAPAPGPSPTAGGRGAPA